jgi:hypothetical protein
MKDRTAIRSLVYPPLHSETRLRDGKLSNANTDYRRLSHRCRGQLFNLRAAVHSAG